MHNAIAIKNAGKIGLALWDPRSYEALIWRSPPINYTSYVKITCKNMDKDYSTELGGGILLRFKR